MAKSGSERGSGERPGSPGQRGGLPLIRTFEVVFGEPAIMTPEEIVAFNNKVRQNRRLPAERKRELRMRESAGLPTLTERDFLSQTPDAIGFAGNLTCYASFDPKNRKATPAAKDDLLKLRYDPDPNKIAAFEQEGIAGSLLHKRSFWRAVEASNLVLPMVVIMSEHRGKSYAEPDGPEVEAFADELAEVNRLISALTDINDPGIK
jgi:hypothetical protein